jgi:Bacterial regulatory proteins, tetR family
MRRSDPDLHAGRRRIILEASLRAFARLGFHKATIPDFAREAGMSAANTHRYFAPRDRLVAPNGVPTTSLVSTRPTIVAIRAGCGWPPGLGDHDARAKSMTPPNDRKAWAHFL